MDATALPNSVRRIVVLSKDPSGAVVPVTLYEKSEEKKKKGMRVFRPLEKAVRRFADATAVYADSYTDRHQDSNRKRRDGWMRDMNINMARAARKGAKRLKINRMFMP